MTRIFLAALTATALALPAAAQRIDIDDDGWSYVEAPAALRSAVDIDDDGWSRVDLPVAEVGRAAIATDGDCTQLERSAGVASGACGTLDLNALSFLQGDD
ncbi:hypothetical protein [Jannaschia formosa]|uniref:hypothetical protein n=1 Tax=Jannaschia formosa TaxID=2259592 RepID=UPI000E1B818F|nr:hypothetical protein [Jannaschia formosa]TFL18408.1 hypothetical protein DR046_09970 [Jannaschia formosa]